MNVLIKYTLRSGEFTTVVDEEEAEQIKTDPDYADDFLTTALESEGISLEDVECAVAYNDDTPMGERLCFWEC